MIAKQETTSCLSEPRDQVLQGWLIGRLQHEDMLFMQRTYNFLTLNIFLGAILVLGTNSISVAVPGFDFAVALMGFILSCLQIAFGRRIECAINFFREYLWMVERETGIAVDRPLFEFYESAYVATPWGVISSRGSHRPIYETFPWSLMPSSNTLMGIWLPWMVAMLWLLFVGTKLYGKSTLLFALVVVVFLALSVFTWIWPRPSLPIRQDPPTRDKTRHPTPNNTANSSR